MSRDVVTVDGLKELEKTLAELPRATGKAALRRVGKRALEPVAEAARGGVTRITGQLADSIAVSTNLSKRQKSLQRRMSNSASAVMVYVGGGKVPHAHLYEFGSSTQPPQPFLRPAWEANKTRVLKSVADQLGEELQKTVARYRKRLAKKAAG